MVDLHDQIVQCKGEGYQIILIGDLNEHILSKNTTFLSSIGMREIILKRHGKKAPATTRSNKIIQPIYGIWGTTGINLTTGGYLTFNQGPYSDHRLLWIIIYRS